MVHRANPSERTYLFQAERQCQRGVLDQYVQNLWKHRRSGNILQSKEQKASWNCKGRLRHSEGGEIRRAAPPPDISDGKYYPCRN